MVICIYLDRILIWLQGFVIYRWVMGESLSSIFLEILHIYRLKVEMLRYREWLLIWIIIVLFWVLPLYMIMLLYLCIRVKLDKVYHKILIRWGLWWLLYSFILINHKRNWFSISIRFNRQVNIYNFK